MRRAEKWTYLTAAIATAEVLYALAMNDVPSVVAGFAVLFTAGCAIISF